MWASSDRDLTISEGQSASKQALEGSAEEDMGSAGKMPSFEAMLYTKAWQLRGF